MVVDERRASWAVGLAALVVRLVHNGAMASSPLYHVPLGGHVVFLDQAVRIAGGAVLPDRPFTENSPLFPYALALVFLVAGGRDVLVARLVGIVADAVTAVLVTRLATRRFGAGAGLAAGLLYAAYAPAVFFAAELVYVPYALLCCTTAVTLLVGAPTAARTIAAGVAYGIAVGFMPSLALGVPLLAGAAACGAGRGRVARAAGALGGVALAVAPVTAANYAASGRFVPLTTSAGHALYLGHNPQAVPGYYLPDRVGAVQAANRGSIFDSMHRIAEESAGHPIADEDVSAFYVGKAWRHVVEHPGAELRLAGRRVAAFVNAYEATTYADFYFQRDRSPLLAALPAFPLLLALAAVGFAAVRLRAEPALLVLPATSLATVVLFFYLARFRMPAVPFLCCFAGHGVAVVLAAGRRREVRRLLAMAAVAGLAFVVASWPMVVPDTSNEWNKMGTLYLAMKRYPDAEHAFETAAAANPRSPDAFLNLQKLYEATGDAERARSARTTADALLAADDAGDRFGRALR